MTDRKRVLILGGSSYIGQSLFAELGSGRAVTTYRQKPIDQGVFFDSLSMTLPEIIESPEDFSHAVILLGDTKPNSCVSDIPKSQAVNVASIRSILDQLCVWGIKPVFTSSEVVFDGAKGDYNETDRVNPILTYGMQKIEVEKHIQKSFENYLIVRLASIFGCNRGDGTLLTSWLDVIEKDEPSLCASDYICSPILLDDAVQSLVRLIDSDCSGIFHLAGMAAYSRLDLYQMLLTEVKKYLPVREAKAVACSIHDFDLPEKRPLNVSLRPDKLIEAVGLTATDMELTCAKLARRVYQQR